MRKLLSPVIAAGGLMAAQHPVDPAQWGFEVKRHPAERLNPFGGCAG